MTSFWKPATGRSIVHGTRSAYNNHRCRCEVCTAANRRYLNGWRAGVRLRTRYSAGWFDRELAK